MYIEIKLLAKATPTVCAAKLVNLLMQLLMLLQIALLAKSGFAACVRAREGLDVHVPP